MQGMRLVSVLLLAGCTSPAPSRDLIGHFSATYEPDGSLVSALTLFDINAKPQQDYVLTSDESAHAEFRGETIPLVAGYVNTLGNGYYASTMLDTPPLEGEPITAELDRGGGERVVFEISAPADFTPSAPASTPQPVTVTWTPTAMDPLRWTSQLGEVSIDGPIPQDVGRIDFPPGVLADPHPTGGVPVTVELTRFRQIQLETTLLGASAEFGRAHDVAFEVVP